MSKRPCPFEDNCAPQLKVHIGSEEVNRDNTTYLKGIYEKTIGKLFQGMQQHNNVRQRSQSDQPQVPDASRVCLECKLQKPITARCWFCEIILCQACVRICNFCCENFCSRCTVAIYKNGNNYTCLTCYN